MEEQLRETIATLVGEFAPNAVETVHPEHTFIEDLGYDSLLLVQFSFILEELFELEPMSLNDAPPIRDVADLQDYMAEKVKAGEATVPSPEAVKEILESHSII